MNLILGRIFIASIAAAMLFGCDLLPGAGGDKPAGPPPMPTPEVSVITAKSQTAPLTRELVGRLAATRIAQVRARVAGIVLERVYTEGTDVNAGAVLFKIDPAQLQAKLRAEEAALAKAEADAVNAALTARRYSELREKKTISQQDVDTALANERTTAAAVMQARANIESARLDLSYATVRAPIAGRAGRALVTEGALVGQGEATLMTAVEQIDPIYINFSQSVRELAELQHGASQPLGNKAASKTKVEVLLSDGATYSETGTLDFSDLAVDPNTGAVSLRTTLSNPQRALLPGMFVTLRLTTGQLEHAFVLPQAAVLRDDKGASVMVLGADGVVAARRVDTRVMTHSDWVVTGELSNGEQVIVAGLQKVKPGAVAKLAAPKPAAGAAPAPSSK
ncbi:efflux RND transporter periplasmic adaptor subunit [Chromatium okenii]|uniref:efflux RND transporter periplasmic adaptor subunit n=1 Tax=Chromatium okenii TaxID=61644 RepID=UPI0026F04552|nr:efflux RND transporter periplasmic adaptor subunit [Chromatium okenii]MBV5308560.1 efflux RND transporter periplasmic adaptor subunit [Chromatium okenii]